MHKDILKVVLIGDGGVGKVCIEKCYALAVQALTLYLCVIDQSS
jgi:tRNA A37 threonylcarbamoyladenosine dehydratase